MRACSLNEAIYLKFNNFIFNKVYIKILNILNLQNLKKPTKPTQTTPFSQTLSSINPLLAP